MRKRIAGVLAAVGLAAGVLAPAALASPNSNQFPGINCSITAQSPYVSGGGVNFDVGESCAGTVGITSKRYISADFYTYYGGAWHYYSHAGPTNWATANPDPWHNFVPCGYGGTSWYVVFQGQIDRAGTDYGQGVQSFAGPGC